MKGKNMTEHEFKIRGALIDFQVGECHDDIIFNPEEYIRDSADALIQEVLFTCKDAYGIAYYDSDIIERNKAVKSDLLLQAVAAGKKYNVNISAYFNILLDDKIADRFPEYRMVNQKGEKVIAYDYYSILCPNSPYAEIIQKIILDVVTRYDINGIFMDITYFQNETCYCRFCREKFMEKFGYPLENDFKEGSTEKRDFFSFRRESRYRLIRDIREAVKKVSNIKVAWNGSGSYYLGEPEIDDQSDYLTSEFHAPDYLDGIIRTKWMQSRKNKLVLTTPYELGSWGDWTVYPEATMEAIFSTIISHGGGISINHMPYPSGEFASSTNKSVLEYIKRNYEKIRTIEPVLTNVTSAADIAVIYSIGTRRLFEWKSGQLLKSYYDSLKGVTKMLLEAGVHFDLLGEDVFREKMNQYKMVILADTACLEQETVKAIDTFTEKGGSLFASGFSSLYDEYGKRKTDFDLSEIFGVHYEGESDFSVDYLYDFTEGLGNMIPGNPILVKSSGSKSLKVSKTKQAVMLASLVEPLVESTIDCHVYHQHAHPARRSGYPSIVMNRKGEGTCIYMSVGIFSSYINTGSPWLSILFRNCLATLHQQPVVKIENSQSVHVTLMKQNEKHILHLVNISDGKSDVSKSFMTEMIPVHDIEVKVNLPVKKIAALPEHTPVLFKKEENGVTFTVPVLRIYQAFVIESKEAENGKAYI
ncbi:MAG: beta-galactosidase trimerization domain-containing protein [Clostridia bacterium]|nr:beta-galactosidase trimerization domain-containing protein [Clostridia bacterium]